MTTQNTYANDSELDESKLDKQIASLESTLGWAQVQMSQGAVKPDELTKWRQVEAMALANLEPLQATKQRAIQHRQAAAVLTAKHDQCKSLAVRASVALMPYEEARKATEDASEAQAQAMNTARNEIRKLRNDFAAIAIEVEPNLKPGGDVNKAKAFWKSLPDSSALMFDATNDDLPLQLAGAPSFSL